MVLCPGLRSLEFPTCASMNTGDAFRVACKLIQGLEPGQDWVGAEHPETKRFIAIEVVDYNQPSLETDETLPTAHFESVLPDETRVVKSCYITCKDNNGTMHFARPLTCFAGVI